MTRIPSDTVVRIRAKLRRENVLGSPQALLAQFLKVDNSDSELQACLAELLKPLKFTDDFFGEFTHERTVNVYAASTIWNDIPVQLRLWFMEGDMKTALAAAHLLWDEQVGWDKRMRDFAVAELLPRNISRKKFEKRISLRQITVEPSGDFEMCYDDGRLFLGHDIVVRGRIHTA